ncbi:hypothetical protein JC525_19090 [Alteromonas sp. IB21]|uniref:hypothetical protein n=1 Tax=Alteromonas sp. IB21 TaxID=2779369 RepID=UPI0018E76423|nr:hypothetical protein [Alteromonas sp. IB21]MBJ2131030.1 hypothetical protein [Alteromonas sp. IB21]
MSLDVSYHQPKHFILGLNNLLRSLLFFVELSNKNSPDWLKIAVNSFLQAQPDEYQILRYLRNVSAHQKLVFPDESLVSGLYRIKSTRNYTLKLGFGDHDKPGKYAWDLALKDTSEIFHDMLAFASITFMDLEHSSIGECLGITRRWFFKVNFKTDQKRYNEIVDVYQLVSAFSARLLDHVCKAYAAHLGVHYEHTFEVQLEDHNFINTLLEIDLFPGLFSDWWEDEYGPLNYGIRSKITESRRHESNDEFHKWVYENLTPDIAAYRAQLDRFASLDAKAIFEKDNIAEFASFVLTNHWHYKSVFGGGLRESGVSASDVMQLQRAGNIFVEEYRKEKLCTIASTKQRLNDQIHEMLKKIDDEQSARAEI